MNNCGSIPLFLNCQIKNIDAVDVAATNVSCTNLTIAGEPVSTILQNIGESNVGETVFTGDVEADSFTATGAVTASSVTSGTTDAGTLTCSSFSTTGSISALGIGVSTALTGASVAATGNITCANMTATGAVTGNTLVGTVTTANQFNITRIGTQTSFAVSGNMNQYSGTASFQATTLASMSTGGNITQTGSSATATLKALTADSFTTAGNITQTGGAATATLKAVTADSLTTTGNATVNGLTANALNGITLLGADGQQDMRILNDGSSSRIEFENNFYLRSGSSNRFTFTSAGTRFQMLNVGMTEGNGSPEGIYVGKVGDIYLRKDGGAGNSIYFKESDTGATGWVSRNNFVDLTATGTATLGPVSAQALTATSLTTSGDATVNGMTSTKGITNTSTGYTDGLRFKNTSGTSTLNVYHDGYNTFYNSNIGSHIFLINGSFIFQLHQANGIINYEKVTMNKQLVVVGTTTLGDSTTISPDLTVNGTTTLNGATTAQAVTATTVTTTDDLTVANNLLVTNKVDGRIGILNTNPQTALDVTGQITASGIKTDSVMGRFSGNTVDIGFNSLYVNGTTKFVGVNKAVPTVPLDVTGAMAVSGNATIGGTLSVGGSTTATGTTTFSGTLTANGAINLNGTVTLPTPPTSRATTDSILRWYQCDLGYDTFAYPTYYDMSFSKMPSYIKLTCKISSSYWVSSTPPKVPTLTFYTTTNYMVELYGYTAGNNGSAIRKWRDNVMDICNGWNTSAMIVMFTVEITRLHLYYYMVTVHANRIDNNGTGDWVAATVPVAYYHFGTGQLQIGSGYLNKLRISFDGKVFNQGSSPNDCLCVYQA